MLHLTTIFSLKNKQTGDLQNCTECFISVMNMAEASEDVPGQ